MEMKYFGKLTSKFVRMIKRNFIDIKFLTIAVLVLLFISLLVFKSNPFREGMGMSYIEGEAEAPVQKTADEVPPKTPESSIGDVNDVKMIETDPVVAKPVVPDVSEPCALCGIECPNRDNACMESKPSCVKCREVVEHKVGHDTTSHRPIVVNVYTGSAKNEPVGVEDNGDMKNANTNLSGLIRGAGYDLNAPADASGSANDINTATVKDMADDYVKKLNTIDVSDNKRPESETSGLSTENGMYGGFNPRTVDPSMSYEILNPAQQEINKMENK